VGTTAATAFVCTTTQFQIFCIKLVAAINIQIEKTRNAMHTLPDFVSAVSPQLKEN